MEIKLGDNIRAFRKKKRLTQEQLAERLNVSVGAISKWEKGISAPEISIIMLLADIFETSVDALLGYRAQDKTRAQVVEEIKEYTRNREAALNMEQTERYISKYPNDFDIVYHTAKLYALRGTVSKDAGLMNKALELLQRSCVLVDQNTDEKISYLSLQTDIAWLYRSLDRNEDALKLYKKYNPCGLNDDRIGVLLASGLNREEEAMPYLSAAFMSGIYMQIDICFGFMNVYEKRGNYKQTAELVDWMLGMIKNTVKPNTVCSLHKIAAAYCAVKANACVNMGDMDKARGSLKQAKAFALLFDSAPCYDATLLRFIELENATAYDDYGGTALDGITNYVEGEGNSVLTALWEEIKNEGV